MPSYISYSFFYGFGEGQKIEEGEGLGINYTHLILICKNGKHDEYF
jgi:hypothetical protein